MGYSPALLELFAGLNSYQVDAVNFGAGMLCLVGVPGSGKTRTVVARIARLIEDGLQPDGILAMTFTRAAALEMTERLQQLGIQGARVGTIHSVCRQIAAGETSLLGYGGLDERDKLRLELKKLLGEYRRKGIVAEYGPDFEGIVRYIEHCKATGPCYIDGDPFGMNTLADGHLRDVANARSSEAGVSPKALYNLYIDLERRRSSLNLYNFDDMLLWAWHALVASPEARGRWRNRWSVVIVDETQDSSPVQWDVARLLSGLESCVPDIAGLPNGPTRDDSPHNLMVAGDSSQCLDGATPISCADGMTEPIQRIRAGIKVWASVGGKPELREVTRVASTVKERHARVFLEDGRVIDGSADHPVFAAIPDLGSLFYVYLMWRADMGFRLGTSHGAAGLRKNALVCRGIGEGADGMWLLEAHKTKAAAALREAELSLRYQIPTVPFHAVGRGMRMGQPEVEQMFAAFGRNGSRLLEEFGIPDSPLWMPHSVGGRRAIVNVVVGGRTHAAEVSVESLLLHPFIGRSIRSARVTAGRSARVTAGRRSTGRIRRQFDDGAEAHAFADGLRGELQRLLPVPVFIRTALGSTRGPSGARFVAVPLAALAPGILVWAERGKPMAVVRVERYRKTKRVYDISVKGATNFFAAGACVHNSIYMWRSAVPHSFVEFSRQPDVTTLVLPLNYRSNAIICGAATALVRAYNWHLGGQIISTRHELPDNAVTIKTFSNVEFEAEAIVTRCRELALSEGGLRSCAVLSRLRVGLDMAEIACIRNRVPYVKMASGSFFESREVRDVLAYLRVAASLDPGGKFAKHVINKPFRFIGAAFISKTEAWAQAHGVDLMTALGVCAEELHYRQQHSIRELLKLHGDLGRIAATAEATYQAAERELAKRKARGDADLPPDTLTFLAQQRAAAVAEADAAGGIIDPPDGPADMIAMVLRRTNYLDELRREEGLLGMDESRIAALAALQRTALYFPTVATFLTYVDTLSAAVEQARKTGLRRKEGTQEDVLVLSTIHRCVAPSTLTETDQGLLPIASVAATGRIGHGDGGAVYRNKVENPVGPAIRIVAEGGYEVTVKSDHGMMAWNGHDYVETRADELRVGQFLRLALQSHVEPLGFVDLPRIDAGDVREVQYQTPAVCDENTAELLGLLVADGTLHHAGFRYVKHDRDVVVRCADLCRMVFGRELAVAPRSDCDAWSVECNSTYIARWLRSIGGLEPHEKAIPLCILQSPLGVQARFLRGLCEDGGVNARTSAAGTVKVDHYAFSSSRPEIAKTVQVMLLRFGIISRRFLSAHGNWRVDMSGRNARRFARRIGCIAERKQQLLEHGEYPRERMHSVPISKAQRELLVGRSARINAGARGYLSRATVETEPGLPRSLLAYHHARVVELVPCESASMCVEVPGVGRFLQNGFDGCNCKGLEWKHVFLMDVAAGRFPCAKSMNPDEELRLFYVALTRAMDSCQVSYSMTGDPDDGREEKPFNATVPVKSEHILRLERVLPEVLDAITKPAESPSIPDAPIGDESSCTGE